MSLIEIVGVILLAGLIHASFQLSISSLTILSSGHLKLLNPRRKLRALTRYFVLGVITTTLLLITSFTYLFWINYENNPDPMVTAIITGLGVGLGVSIWAFYYQRSKGTVLWLPRDMASFISNRSKKTDSLSEAFGLGMVSVIAELLFIFGPLSLASIAITKLNPNYQVLAIILYTLSATSSLILVAILVNKNGKLAKIQKWREENKNFLQFIAGTGLIILSLFIYVFEVLK